MPDTEDGSHLVSNALLCTTVPDMTDPLFYDDYSPQSVTNDSIGQISLETILHGSVAALSV